MKKILIILLLICFTLDANCSINWRRFLPPGGAIGIGISIIFHRKTTQSSGTPPIPANAVIDNSGNVAYDNSGNIVTKN